MAGIWTGNSGLRRAHAADLAAIMDMERQPGYELVVGQSTYAEHIRNISRPGQLYLVSDDDRGMPHAFAALCGLGYRERDVLLKRLMVRTPGQGTGSRFLSAVMRAVFEGAPTERLFLRVLPDNERALKLYRKLGFHGERLLPSAGMRADGKRVDLLMMEVTREEWDLRNQGLGA